MQAPRRLQLRRGNTAAISTYVGAPGELIVDTTTNTLYLHNGVTVGGTATTVNTASITSNISSLQGNIITLTANAGVQAGNIASLTSSVTGANAAIVTANTNMKGYVDAANTIQTNQITTVSSSVTGANAAIVTANTNMKGYADAITTAWTSNAATQLSQITAANAAIVTANTALKAYVDAANTIQTNQITTVSSSVTGANAAIVTANTNMKGYVDAQIIGASGYGNSNVATYLPTYDGNIAANISKAGYTWTFGTDAVLTLPSGATILESGYGSAGAIRLKPNGGTSTQYLEIAPTAADGNHVHLMAGSGTELFLGDDNQYVKLANTGGVVINSNDGAGNTAQWTFGTNGNLNLPQGGTITEGGGLTGAIRLTPAGGANANQALLIYPTGTAEGDHIHLTAAGGSTELYLGNDLHYVKLVDGGNVELRASTANLSAQAAWTFDTTGNIDTIQALGIKVPNGVPTDVAIINSTTGSWEANPNLSLATTGGSGTGLTVNVAETGGYASTIEIATAGTGYTNGDLITVTSGSSNATFTIVIGGRNTWRFGTDGNLTLPSDGYLRITSGITSTNASPAPKISGFTITNSQGISGNGNITTTQYVDAGYFVGNGALLTGIVAGTTYSNSNVASYLPTYSGNIAGNIAKNGYTWTFSEAGATTFPTGVRLSNARGANTVNFTTDVDKSFQIETGTAISSKLWSFGPDGNLTLPQNANINYSNGVSILSTVTDLYSNAAVQSGDIANIFANLGAVSGSLATLTANAGAQAGSLATITSVLTSSNVAIGENAAYTAQGQYAVAIGLYAGGDTQGERAVAIGSNAGKTAQGAYAVAIGRRAGETNQGNNSIIINATTGVLNQTTANTFTVAPIRNDSGNVAQALYYNTTTKEVTYANATAGGNYSNTNVAAYLSTATITTTGNVTAANFVGNISITGNVTGTSSNVTLQAGAYTSVFDNQGNVTVPQLFTAGNIQTAGYFVGNGTLLTGVAIKTTGSWTVPTGNSTQSFTVPTSGTYQLWVDCNIPNGILAWNATATVTNSNVPVVEIGRAHV